MSNLCGRTVLITVANPIVRGRNPGENIEARANLRSLGAESHIYAADANVAVPTSPNRSKSLKIAPVGFRQHRCRP